MHIYTPLFSFAQNKLLTAQNMFLLFIVDWIFNFWVSLLKLTNFSKFWKTCDFNNFEHIICQKWLDEGQKGLKMQSPMQMNSRIMSKIYILLKLKFSKLKTLLEFSTLTISCMSSLYFIHLKRQKSASKVARLYLYRGTKILI